MKASVLQLVALYLSIHDSTSFQSGSSFRIRRSSLFSLETEKEQSADSQATEQRVSASDASLVVGSTFSDNVPGLPDWLEARCHECGWRQPTVIQQRAWEAIGEGHDVVLQAQTGSGKTLAFLIPLLSAVDPTRAAIQAVIVVPTRELGLQVGRVAKRLTAKQPIMVMNILQGSTNKRQRAWAWSEPPQVVIGTPQELTDMVQYGGIRYNSIQYVVVDEVDACLLNNGGSLTTNAGPLHTLLSKHLSPTYDDGSSSSDDETVLISTDTTPEKRPLSKRRQTIFCSATIPQHRHFLKQCVSNQWTIQEPVYVCANPGDVLPPSLTHSYIVASRKDKKVAALRRLVQRLGKGGAMRKVLIFCEPNRPLDAMAQVLAKDLDGIFWKQGYGQDEEQGAAAIVSVLRFEDSIANRASAMLGFQGSDGGAIEGRQQQQDNGAATTTTTGPVRILLSTDHAARGLDVEDVTHVVQFDLPHEADTYVHRAGRAGRLDRPGWVVSILTTDQEFVLQRMANKLGLGDQIKCVGRQAAAKK